jgi:hypothetical protein
MATPNYPAMADPERNPQFHRRYLDPPGNETAQRSAGTEAGPVGFTRNGNTPSSTKLTRRRQAEADRARALQYVSVLRWRDRELSTRFSTAVVELVREYDPDAFETDGKPA